MSVSVKKETYVSHGQEFETKAEADRHDALHTARHEYEDAQQKLQRLLAETQRTADGQVFQFGLFHDYYAVVTFFGFPALEKVSFFCRNWAVQEDEFGVSIKADNRERWFRITDLYADKRNADRALADAQTKELEALVEQVSTLRRSVGFSGVHLRHDD